MKLVERKHPLLTGNSEIDWAVTLLLWIIYSALLAFIVVGFLSVFLIVLAVIDMLGYISFFSVNLY